MEKNLDHLTSEQIECLMQRYYAGESASKLVKEYNRNLLRYYPLLSASNRCYFNGFQSG